MCAPARWPAPDMPPVHVPETPTLAPRPASCPPRRASPANAPQAPKPPSPQALGARRLRHLRHPRPRCTRASPVTRHAAAAAAPHLARRSRQITCPALPALQTARHPEALLELALPRNSGTDSKLVGPSRPFPPPRSPSSAPAPPPMHPSPSSAASRLPRSPAVFIKTHWVNARADAHQYEHSPVQSSVASSHATSSWRAAVPPRETLNHGRLCRPSSCRAAPREGRRAAPAQPSRGDVRAFT